MFETINGAEIYYDVLGAENERAIMALHGGPGVGDHRKPMESLRALSDEYQLVVFDYRGCGQSEATGPYSNEQFADDAEALRQHLDLGPVVMYGGSYGGFVTQEYAIRHGENLAGFVTRGTGATPDHLDEARETFRERIPELQGRDLDVPSITVEDYDRIMAGRAESDEDLKRVFHGMLPLYAPSLDEFDAEEAREGIEDRHYHHETHNKLFSEVHPNMDHTGGLPDVEAPALVTVGRNDWIAPVSTSKRIADLVLDSRLVIFESSGHSPNLDQEGAYVQRIREFCSEIGFDNRKVSA